MITSKAQMYELLRAGRLGNTIPQFMSVDEWQASPDSRRYEYWGVRSSRIANHPACQLYTKREAVAKYAAKHFSDGVNISMMVDAVATVTAWIEVFESNDCGLVVEGILSPKISSGWTWRNSMSDPTRRRQWWGSRAVGLLKYYLNGNSQDDLRDILDRYPGHVVELTTIEECIGILPHRNSIVWEVRHY